METYQQNDSHVSSDESHFPHKHEAERCVLGSILLDNSSLDRALEHLRPFDFHLPSHQLIFKAFLFLDSKNKPIDIVLLTEYFISQKLLDEVGGTRYLAGLASIVPTSAHIEHYAVLVKGSSIKRRLLSLANNLRVKALDVSSEAAELLEYAEKEIFDVAHKANTRRILSLQDVVPQAMEHLTARIKDKEPCTGTPTGFIRLDALTSGFQKSEMIVLGARPSVGKTAFALNMAAHMALHRRIPTGFFTLEMSAEALTQRILAGEARVSASKLRTGHLRQGEHHSISETAQKLYDAPLYIEETPNIRLFDLRSQARRMCSVHNVEIIFIDYLTLVGAEDRSIQRFEQVAEISRSLKALARELNIPIVVLSQVNRDAEGRPPTMAHLRESSSIEQDADVIIFLHRERDSKSESAEDKVFSTEVMLAKQRNGPTGNFTVLFHPEFVRFENAEEHYS